MNTQNVQSPKFQVNRLAGCITINMNLPMAESVIYLLEQFEDLQTHEFALKERLQDYTKERLQDYTKERLQDYTKPKNPVMV